MANYRLKLERESDGKVLYAWSRISEQKIRPLLSALRTLLPILVQAARTKQTITELLAGPR
jgi:hypothetical protein